MTLLEQLINREIKIKKEKELFNKKLNKLSLTERNAYEEIVERNYPKTNSWTVETITVIPQIILYLFIAGLVLLFFMDINIMQNLKELSFMFIKIWGYLIAGGLIIDMINYFQEEKFRKELLR